MRNRRIKRLLSIVLCVVLVMSNIAYADAAKTEVAKYADIAGNMYETQIRQWIANGFIKGYPDGNFKPQNQITRSEFMALVNRAYGFTDTMEISYSDVNKTHWYYNDAAKAVKAGFIQGSKGKLMPLDNISRQEMATIIARLTKNEKAAAEDAIINNFTDKNEIPAWSKAAISTAMKNKFFDGFVDKAFKPTEKITRLEAVVALDRAFKSMYKGVFNSQGTFGPETGIVTLDGNVVVISPEVTLRNTTINGNLILRETIGEGNVYLDNVVVKGETIVKGGGANSIVIKNSTLGKVIVIKEGNTVRIVAMGSTTIGTVDAGSSVKLEEDQLTGAGFNDVITLDDIPMGANVVFEGVFGEVEISSPNINVAVEGGSIASMNITETALGTNINIGQQSTVTTMTLDAAAIVSGTGTIGTANINATGTVIAQSPTTVVVAPSVTAQVGGVPVTETVTPIPSAGGGGGGGGGGGNNGGNNGGTKVKLNKPANAVRTDEELRARWDKVNNSSGYIVRLYEGSKTADNLLKEVVVSKDEYEARMAMGGFGLFRMVATSVENSGNYLFTVAAKGTGNYLDSDEVNIGAPVIMSAVADAAGLDSALSADETSSVLVVKNDIEYKINGEFKNFVRPERIKIIVGHNEDYNSNEFSVYVAAKNFTSANNMDFPWFSIRYEAVADTVEELNNAFEGFGGSIRMMVPEEDYYSTIYPSGFGFKDEDGNVVVDVRDINTLKIAVGYDSEIDIVNIKEDILDIDDTIIVINDVTINGDEHALGFANDEEGWQGNYVIQVYKTADVAINDLKLTAGDAGLLVNGSTVTLGGTINVSGNEFGGIEVSKGVGVTEEPKLTIADEANLVNGTEKYKKPTIWEDGVFGKVEGFAGVPVLLGTQHQYYLVPVEHEAVDYDAAAELGTWVKDRTEPKSWVEANGWITHTTSELQASNSWYDWQGRGTTTNVGLTDRWKVETQIELTEELLNGTGVRSSMWIQVDGVNGAHNTQNNVLDWAILQYKNDPTNDIKGWESWDSVNGLWLPVVGIPTEKGIYTLTMIYDKGTISQYINGSLVREYSIETDEGHGDISAPSYLIIQSRTFGEEYTAKWKVPTVEYLERYPSEAKFISSLDQLKAAIKNQADGQTWIITEGTYDIPRDALTLRDNDGKVVTTGGQSGWYMPITANNLTIIGVGDPVITSSTKVPNGAWASQNLITVWGDNVTLEGLTITPKVEANKSIEVVGDKQFTIGDCTFGPNTIVEGADATYGGSLYFNGRGEAGTKAILIKNNTFNYTSVAFDGVTGGNIAIIGNTFENIGGYAIGNTYWGSADRITEQYANVYVNGNSFNNVGEDTKIIAARLNQTFILDGDNKVNGAAINKDAFEKYINFNNLTYWSACKDNRVIVDGITYNSPYTGIVYVKDASQLKAAISAAKDGDTIWVAAGTYALTEQLNITKAITIAGQGTVTIKAVPTGNWRTENGYKHLLAIYAGTVEKPVVVSNIVFDANNKSHGVNTYNNAHVDLDSITIQNSIGAGLTVNGSTIEATNLNTSGNAWGAVNVDPGSGVKTASSFKLNSGTLDDVNQIWSDGKYVDENATVAVTADGYDMYAIGGKTAAFIWTDKELTNAVTITKDNITTLYPSIQAAIDDAMTGDTINISEGNYQITTTINVNKAVIIKGAADYATKITTTGGNPVFKLSAAATLDSIFIDKTDDINQHLVTIVAKDAKVLNSKFMGTYTQGESQTTRAIVPNAGITGYIIQGNHIENLRQPGYLEGAGTVANNFVKNTRGWVVCVNHAITFTGNTFEGNAVDIAIIANGQTQSDNYLDIAAISEANDGAYVENQLIKASAKDGNIVVDADGNENMNSVQNAVNAAQAGDTIELLSDITTDEKILINKSVTINGNGNTISFIGDEDGWNGNYVLHVYDTTDVIINDIGLTGADGGLLVNGSEVILSGNIDVSGNEFGGIESSKGENVQNDPLLIVTNADFKNSTEEYGKPTIWEDGVEGTVTGFEREPIMKGTQPQYYLVEAHEVADAKAPIIKNASLEVDNGLIVEFSINEEIDLGTEEANIVISYFTEDENGRLIAISNTMDSSNPLVKDKSWDGYLWGKTDGTKYSKGDANVAANTDLILANTVLQSLVRKGHASDGSMDYVEIDWTTPATYVVKIQVIDNAGNVSDEVIVSATVEAPDAIMETLTITPEAGLPVEEGVSTTTLEEIIPVVDDVEEQPQETPADEAVAPEEPTTEGTGEQELAE